MFDSSRRGHAWRGMLLVLAIASLYTVTESAFADPYAAGPPSSGWRPDNSEHTYCWRANYTGANPRSGGNHGMRDALDAQTTMFDNRVPSCNSNTDAKFHKASLGPGVDGSYLCLSRSGTTCFSARLNFDTGNITSLQDWKQTACHEVGHSVGLTHHGPSGPDCMGSSAGQTWALRHYGSHRVAHINNDR